MEDLEIGWEARIGGMMVEVVRMHTRIAIRGPRLFVCSPFLLSGLPLKIRSSDFDI